MKRLISALAAVGYLAGAAASAQSLVEVAKKEKERRKKVEAQPTREFTERDIRTGIGTRASSSNPAEGESGAGETAAPAESSGAAGPQQGAATEDPTATESYWRERASAIDAKIRDLEARLQSPELTSNTRGAADRAAAERDLAQAKAERQALAEEARRKGVPPGWLR